MAQENKNAEKGCFPIMLYPHESQSQKSNHVDKLFTNTIRLSSLHECPRLPTILAEIFQSSTFFPIQLSPALHLLRAIFFSSVCSEQNWWCKGYLLLNSFSANWPIRWLVTKSSSLFTLITPARKSVGGDWGSQELAETSRNFPEPYVGSFVSVLSDFRCDICRSKLTFGMRNRKKGFFPCESS